MDIIDEIRADREAGALRLEREYKPRLLAVAARFCPDETEAEALVYRTIDEAIRCIETLSDPNAFFGWMCGIMSNQYGKLNRRKIDGQIVYTDKVPEDMESGGAENVVQAVDATLLREAVEGLPDKLREAVILRYFADMPVMQIARFLTIPVGTVNSRLHLARMALSMRLGAKLKKPAVAIIAAALFLAASAAMVAGIAALSSGDASPPTDEMPVAPTMISTTSQGEEQMKTNAAKSVLFGVAAAALAGAANAAPAVTIDSVAQRWPWNNKVDITYTVAGGQTRSAGVYCALRFAVTAKGQTYDFEGYTVGASAENGQHTVTWFAPQGIVSTDCSMTATLFTTNVPSGNDYMIIDLASGGVTYEGLFATQDESNSRYNVADYKTDKMVLRKIPRTADSADLPNGPFASGYPTGDSANYPSGNNANTAKTWMTDQDYYIGVFPVTQYQYQKLYGSNPSEKTATITGNMTGHRPVEKVSWDDLRLSSTTSTSSIPAVASNSGTFFQRLNFKTGLYFDLPTEVMFEMAERAGATTTYYWGNTMITNYVVCSENSANSTVAVGSRLPNSWGLYDMAGNVWEWCLDGKVDGNMVDRSTAFTPIWTSTSSRRSRGGGSSGNAMSHASFHASNRGGSVSSIRVFYLGFRVSLIVK